MKKLLVVLALALAGAAAFEWSRRAASPAPAAWKTVPVERGEVVEGVAASGAVQPLVSVQIGSQVSGVIAHWFKDWNDEVRAGETIAVLETGRLAAQVEQDEAAVDRAHADCEHVEAQIWQAERDYDRQQELVRKDVISQSDMDASTANVRLLKANRAVAASVVSQSLAQLKSDQLNLRHATITSPIDGVVISRHVDVGQTVAASLQAPTLFVIAQDLKRIQIQASVPESEIGKLRGGQKARFTFDTYPGKKFEGVVSQVRLAPQTAQNVVTYTVLVDAGNEDGRLFPGMTANVVFEIERSKKDGLRVPVAAVRYRPPPSLVASDPSEKKPRDKKDQGKVWIPTPSGLVRAVPVKLGITDGTLVSIEPLEKGALEDGTEVVVGVSPKKEDASMNPFGPAKR